MTIRAVLIAAAIALAVSPASSGELAAFGAAVERADAQYQYALRTLDTAGRERAAAEVRAFREAWQDLIDRYETDRPAELAGEDFVAATFTEIDARLVGALIVIDIGSREAARAALLPIGDTLARLRARTRPVQP